MFSNYIFSSTLILIILNVLHTKNGATIIADESRVSKVVSPAHFVLVHGACHGGWSWYKVRTLLESAGHNVSSPDLRSAGIDPTDANTIFTFQHYNKPLYDILTSIPAGEKVIIAGHSSGGVSVSDAIQNFPEKIKVGIYVVGQMVRSQTEQEKIQVEEPSNSKISGLDVFDYFYEQGRENPPTSAIFRKEIQHKILYNKSPLEDSTLAALLMKPCPIRAMESLTDGSSRVPRVYIRTLHDTFFPIEKQNELIKNWPPCDVYTVDSDHFPMFSNPSELVHVLVKVAAKFTPNSVDIY